jgi:predicted DCC family thiol-disulfide oxidoreductase YuxK
MQRDGISRLGHLFAAAPKHFARNRWADTLLRTATSASGEAPNSVSPPVGPVLFRRYLRARSLLYLFIPVVDEVVLGRGGCPPTFVAVKPFELIQRKHNTMSSTLTVWYNIKCPVCNGGIEWQRRRLVRAARAGLIEFRDINLEPDVLSRFGAGVEDVRRRLHAIDAEGRLHVGADCAIAIWLRTPGDVWLGRVLRLPVIHPIARVGYDRFADLLYAWNRWRGHW